MKNIEEPNNSVTIVGCGILGLITATLISEFLPDYTITLIDAGPDPTTGKHPHSATFGKGKDARHFTGSESLSFQVHAINTALSRHPMQNNDIGHGGWQLIPESELNVHEIAWRADSQKHYTQVVGKDRNQYDELHAQLNYAGMYLWDWLRNEIPTLDKHMITDSFVRILFWSEANYTEDKQSENYFYNSYANKWFQLPKAERISAEYVGLVNNGNLSQNCLLLPGSAWKIQSIAKDLIGYLANQHQVNFRWNTHITDDKLPGNAVWAIGTTYGQPSNHQQISKVQGVAGCWVEIPNPGFHEAFKISLPQPIGYVNCTPAGGTLLVSGGFGWSGTRSYDETEKLMQPIAQIFGEKIGQCFGINPVELSTQGKYPVTVCVRPSSPTGLADIRTRSEGSGSHIYISGSSKSGSTQSPVLALFVCETLRPGSVQAVLSQDSKLRAAFEAVVSLEDVHAHKRALA